MKLPSVLLSTTLLAAGSLLVGTACAAPTAEEVLRAELRETIARVMASEAFAGRPASEIGLTLTVPGERYLDLGLLLDRGDAAREGVRVLGTTPGGSAQQLGLRAGDLITAIGGTSLVALGSDADGSARATTLLKSTLDALPDDARLALSVVRDGRSIQFDGAIAARYLPPLRVELGEGNLISSTGAAAAAPQLLAAGASAAADSGCGRISTFHIAPRSQKLYPARVLSIDGSIPGPAGQDTYRLAPGAHTVEVAEAIDATDLPPLFSRRRTALGRQTFSVTVEPGQTHLVAARLLDGSGGRAYWEPVVWKSIAEDCR